MQRHLHLEVHAHFEKVSTDTVFRSDTWFESVLSLWGHFLGQGTFSNRTPLPFHSNLVLGWSKLLWSCCIPMFLLMPKLISTWIYRTNGGNDVGTLYSPLGAVGGLVELTFRWCI